MWLRLLLALIGLSRQVLRYLEARQDLATREAARARESLEETHAIISRVVAARGSLMHDPDSVRNDPRNRDERGADTGADQPDSPEHRVRKLL